VVNPLSFLFFGGLRWPEDYSRRKYKKAKLASYFSFPGPKKFACLGFWGYGAASWETAADVTKGRKTFFAASNHWC